MCLRCHDGVRPTIQCETRHPCCKQHGPFGHFLRPPATVAASSRPMRSMPVARCTDRRPVSRLKLYLNCSALVSPAPPPPRLAVYCCWAACQSASLAIAPRSCWRSWAMARAASASFAFAAVAAVSAHDAWAVGFAGVFRSPRARTVIGPPRPFRTAELELFHAARCRFRCSLWTSCGVL